jgi:hypothetical protein
MARILLVGALLLASWGGSLGIAFGVTEWRGDTERVLEREVLTEAKPTATPTECERLQGLIAEAQTEDAVLVLFQRLPDGC